MFHLVLLRGVFVKNMVNKRKLTESELDQDANISDSDWKDFEF